MRKLSSRTRRHLVCFCRAAEGVEISDGIIRHRGAAAQDVRFAMTIWWGCEALQFRADYGLHNDSESRLKTSQVLANGRKNIIGKDAHHARRDAYSDGPT